MADETQALVEQASQDRLIATLNEQLSTFLSARLAAEEQARTAERTLEIVREESLHNCTRAVKAERERDALADLLREIAERDDSTGDDAREALSRLSGDAGKEG